MGIVKSSDSPESVWGCIITATFSSTVSGMVFDTLNCQKKYISTHTHTIRISEEENVSYLEYNVLVEYMLDTRCLILGLALCKLSRLGAAVKYLSVRGKLRDFGELLGILSLSLGNRRWWGRRGFR